jgi:hypothetical protein
LIVIVSPLGVLVSLILVAPNRTILLGVISSWSWVVIVSDFFLSSCHYSVDEPDFSYSTVQNHEPVEWERVEQS